jgi:hypothetical protein
MRRLVGLIDNEGFDAGKFLLESRHEIVRTMFKQHDKTESKKQKQNDPKKAAKQGHVRHRNLVGL